MEHVGKVLRNALQMSGMKKKFLLYHCLLHWQQIVGPDIGLHTSPGLVQGGTLFVTVDNAVWCHHLTMMKEDIVKKINQFAMQNFATEKIIRNIRFQAGELKNSQNEEKIEENDQGKRKVLVSKEDTTAAGALVHEINDEKLKFKLQRLISTDIATKKLRKLSHWQACCRCEVICPPEENYCSACQVVINQERELAIRKLLLEVPWLPYEECNQYQPCTKEVFFKAKNRLIEKMAYAIYLGHQDTLQIATLVMLIEDCKPAEITVEMTQNAINKYSRRHKNVFTSRS